MEIEDVQKRERRDRVITIRTYLSYFKWMKDNKIKPSKVFNKAIEELMKKTKK